MTAPSWGRQYRPVDPTVPLDGQAKEVNYGPDSRLELHTSFPEMHIALIVLARTDIGFLNMKYFLI